MSRPILILENLRSALNVGSIIRSAACFDIEEVLAVGTTPYISLGENDERLPHIQRSTSARIKKTSLGAEEHVSMDYFKNLEDLLEKIPEDAVIVALERTLDSTLLHDSSKVLTCDYLIVGNEVEGVSSEALKLSAETVSIPQSTKKESLNVTIATSIALFHMYST